jgi:hypothetical protein
MFNVSLRIVDSASQKPVAVRLRISDREGRTYAPLGRLAEFATGRNEDVGGHLWDGGEAWCYINGDCEVPLPAGMPLVIEARHGPEYLPLRHEVMLGPGQMALRFTMERYVDYRARGWYSGDTRCHFLSPHAALLEGMAEDLGVVSLLVRECPLAGRDGRSYPSLPNVVAFSGQRPALERDGHLVAVNTFHTHPVLGQLSLLHCHRAIFPLSFGGAEQTDDWSLADWCDQCHRKKGLVVWSDPFRFENGLAPEALADLINGRIDAVECTSTASRLDAVYSAWSAGIRFPLVGASGKDSNCEALGGMRTYALVAKLDEASASSPLQCGDWIEAVRTGKTVITSGPLLQFTVDGQLPGSIVDRTERTKPLQIAARMESALPAGRLEIIRDGEVAAQAAESENAGRFIAEINVELPIAGGCWLAARCVAAPQSTGFAHSSPIFVRCNGQMPLSASVIRDYVKALQRTADWVEAAGRFEIPRRKEHLLAILKQAQRAQLARLE